MSRYAAGLADNTIFKELLPYKPNFDRILGMLDGFYIIDSLLLNETIQEFC